jgi:NitT/TauT family transport system permease protein
MSRPETKDTQESPLSKQRRKTTRYYNRLILRRVIIPSIILVVLWQLIAYMTQSSLLDVYNALVQLALVGDSDGHFLTEHIQMSLTRVTIGFSVAAITAIPLGIMVGRYRIFDSILGPVVEAIRPIPPIAWIPLAILLFRTNMLGAQVFIIWIGAFFPILINTTTGVKRTELVHIDAAKTFGANELQILSKVVVPSAGPEVFAGLRIGFGIGWMCLVAAEMIGGGLGLGYLVLIMQQVGRTGAVIASMLLIGLIGFLISYFFLYIERHLLKWRQTVSV